MIHLQADTTTELRAIDNLGLRMSNAEAFAWFLCAYCGMQRTESPEGFTVLAPDGAHSRLFLFQAEEPPDPGVLQRVVLRVSDFEGAVSELPDGLEVQRPEPELAVFLGPDGLEIGLASYLGGAVDYELDHVVLRVMDPDETAIAMAEVGFVLRAGAIHVADKHVRLEPGIRSSGESELLTHIGVLVDSVEALADHVLPPGLATDKFTFRPNELGLYVRGPERIRIEYTEQGSAG